MSFRELQLAALLHDIGKFAWRAGEKHRRHPELSEGFIDLLNPPNTDKELVKTLVLHHHDTKGYSGIRVSDLPKSMRRFARIVSEADNISSAMDRDRYEDGEAEHPLQPILAEVRLGEKDRVDESLYYPPVSLDLDNIFPQHRDYMENDIEDMCHKTWESFSKEIEDLPDGNFKSWYSSLNYLLKKYTTKILSAGYKTKPDIPLYDHLKTSAAIASSLYLYCEENKVSPKDDEGESKRYLLIMGDISGIQNFIFKVSNPQEARKGMAKRLRGRSFWLSLIMDSITMGILDILNLEDTNVLWNTGGHFLIISPNLRNIKEELDNFRRKINGELLRKYDGDIFLALHWRECSKNDLKNFGKLKEEVGLETELIKRQKFVNFVEKEFSLKGENKPIEKYCVVCRKPVDRERICKSCRDLENLGQDLAKADYILVGRNLDSPYKFTEYEYLPVEERYIHEYLKGVGSGVIKIFKLNDTSFLDLKISKKYPNVICGFRFLGNVVPSVIKNNKPEILSFGEIAQLSKGARKIGVIKADVDDLGLIFAKGLKGEESDRSSVSRIHNLSFMFDLFFAGYLNEICKRYYVLYGLCSECKTKLEKRKIEVRDDQGEIKYQFYDAKDNEVCNKCRDNKVYKLYINYSGGDDLLIVGPWDVIVKISLDIRREFKNFICQNT